MKKSISKTIVTIAIVTAFLMPLMGNTALADTTATYYFDGRDTTGRPIEEWEADQDDMIDGDPDDYASTTIDGDVQLLNQNMCPDTNLGSISKVEIRVKGYYMVSGEGSADIILRAVYSGGDGNENIFEATLTASWSAWFDITGDPYSPGLGNWDWDDVRDLDCDVKADGSGSFTLFGSKVEIRVTYTPA